ncbi:MAG: hypothetical protein JNK64_25570 [Myxococcales bacterium]|nr:hypothetical protein [Myxococcales bacterium]
MSRRFETDDATLVREPGVDALAGVMPKLDDEPGPARRLSTARTSRMVADILAAAATAPLETSTAPAPPTTTASAPAPRKRWVPLLAAALVAAAVVGAGAAVITTRLMSSAPAPQAAPPASPPPAPAVTPPAPPAPSPNTSPTPVEVAPIDVAPTAPPSPRPRAPAADDAPAADLLARANQARKDRAWRDADALYRRVAARFAGTDAAVVAQLASATLHLEHLGDARGALATYRRALAARPGGELGEEARWGIAEATRALGDRAGEAAALTAFLDAHPGSALAPAAQRRLAALSSTP